MAKEKSLSIQAIKKRINDRFFFMTYNKLVENQEYTKKFYQLHAILIETILRGYLAHIRENMTIW